MVFIGFIAEKESGKTTTFNYIKGQLPQAQEVMLAEHLKEACSKVFKMELYRMESQEEKKKLLTNPVVLTREDVVALGDFFEMEIPEAAIQTHIGKELKTTRQILQYVGTDILRSIEDDIHLKWAMKRAPKSEVYVVTDIRFPNEFDFFEKKEHFLPFYIDRQKNKTGDESANHSSETHIQELRTRCLGEIDNNRDLEFLRNQVEGYIVPLAERFLSK